uniref:CHP-rich zinc finger protein n=1 Tax=Solanum tuberosum TaxID=4113 RepID=M1A4K0_SOLTU
MCGCGFCDVTYVSVSTWLSEEVIKGISSCFGSSLPLKSCISNISTLLFVFFLIFIATSCGMKFPQTITLL